jgi:Uma2 family endonuclease
MATAVTSPPQLDRPEPPDQRRPPTIGPEQHGLAMSLDAFNSTDLEPGWLYELAQGVVIVTEVPGPRHGRIVWRFAILLDRYHLEHPGVISFRAGGGECRLRLPGMQSDRHPDQAIYLDPQPQGPDPWRRWCPHLVVEVVSPRSEDRDYAEKREEYLRAGVREYWILDPIRRRLLVLRRQNDIWEEVVVPAEQNYRCELLPGLEVRPVDLIGPADEVGDL